MHESGGQWNRFTAKLQKTIFTARSIAEEYRHEFISPDTLILALIKEGSSQENATSALSIIDKMGVELSVLRKETEKRITHGTFQGEVNLSVESRRVLDKTYDFSRKLNNNYIGTEHLLLGLASIADEKSSLYELGLADVNKLTSLIVSIRNESEFNKQPAGGGKREDKKDVESILSEYSRNLTAMARAGDIDPVIGRQDEIDRVIQTLARKNKSNVCLTGDPGVGKTAIVEGLALSISEGEVPEELINCEIYSIDLGMLVAGTKYRGEFEERMKGIISECQRRKDEVILFIDEIHTMIGAGSAEGSLDAGNMLKPALARGEIRVIGATTVSEYRRHFEKDEALARRFQSILVEEPSIEDTIEILTGLKSKYEEHHKVIIDEGAVKAAVHLSNRYIKERFQPDKSLDLIDEGCSKQKLNKTYMPRSLRDVKAKCRQLNDQIARLPDDSDERDKLEDEFDALLSKEDELETTWNESLKNDYVPVVTEEVIASIIQSWTGIPVTNIEAFESNKLLQMEDKLREKIIGQAEAISAVTRAIKRSRSGIRNPNRPIASMMFVGPTGAGKTELCKVLANYLFNNPNAFIRFDMSEFMDAHTSSKLIGAPPGYVGYGEGGQLTEAVRRTPYSLVLLDEIEKAHHDIFNVLLQILEDGHATDGQGRKVNFQNCIIIMTSNVGIKPVDSKPQVIGFREAGDQTIEAMYKTTKASILSDLKETFRPEFLNRLDDTVVFQHLSIDDILMIIENMLEDLNNRSENSGVIIELSSNTKDKIAKEGYDMNMGARPLRRAFQNLIEDPLSDYILAHEVDRDNPTRLYLDLDDNGNIVFSEVQ